MKKLKIILLLLILFPLVASAQLIGVGIQYADAKSNGNDLQFAASTSFPIWKKPNVLNTFVSSGIDYTGGSSPVAGLNIKPLQFTSYLSESLFNNHPLTILVGCDAGYLFNFRHGRDGIVLTPNIYMDYQCIYMKTGWDFNVTGNKQQFFLRIGAGFSIGSFKSYAKTKIR